MRKVIALLLALMLPLSAVAEAYSFTLSVSTDDELFPWYLKEAMAMTTDVIDDQDAEVAIRLLQAFLDDLHIDIHVQNQSMTLEISVGRNPLFDLTVVSDEQVLQLTSSLFSGYVLISDDSKQAPVKSFAEALSSSEWVKCQESAHKTIVEWIDSLEPVISSGVFTGDAYEDGVVCKTWSFTDQDIAGVVNSVFSQELRAALAGVLDSLDIDAESVFAKFQETNDNVADQDAHMYILRMVEDAAGNLCGVSLTILKEMQQIATVSFGITAKGIKFVVGLGLNGNNYWWEFVANKRQRNNMTTLSGTSREWLAEKELDFSYVSGKVAPVSNYDWHCYITKSGRRYLWDASVYEDLDQTGYRYLYSSDGKVNTSTGELDMTLALGDSPYVPASLNVKFMSAAPKTVALDDLQQVSMTQESAEYETLLQKATAMLSARLLKILPADLFVMLMQMNLDK